MPVVKVCNGPSHDGPTELPLTEEYWYFHKSGRYVGKPIGRCKNCVNWAKLKDPGVGSGTVKVADILPFAIELQLRAGGIARAACVAGIGTETLRAIVGEYSERCQKRIAARIMYGLIEQRKADRINGKVSDQWLALKREQGRREERLERLTGY